MDGEEQKTESKRKRASTGPKGPRVEEGAVPRATADVEAELGGKAMIGFLDDGRLFVHAGEVSERSEKPYSGAVARLALLEGVLLGLQIAAARAAAE